MLTSCASALVSTGGPHTLLKHKKKKNHNREIDPKTVHYNIYLIKCHITTRILSHILRDYAEEQIVFSLGLVLGPGSGLR